MWALIVDNTVTELTDIDPKDRYHPSWQWEAVPDQWRPWIQTGYRWHDDTAGFLPPTVDHLRTQMLAALAERRWRSETGGLSLHDGLTLRTDRESQSLLAGAAAAATRDPSRITRWKFRDGWADLPAAQILSLADRVADHVADCFRREAVLSEALTKTPDTDGLLALWSTDITAGWPG